MEFATDDKTGAAMVPLHSKTHPGLFARVDPGDAHIVAPYHWWPQKNGHCFYAHSSHYGHRVSMHRLILGVVVTTDHVDHINHDGLDNRRSNLRITSRLQNRFNQRGRFHTTSSYKGVCWHSGHNRWHAKIKIHQHVRHLGYFPDEIAAACAYDAAARELFGEHAYLNFPGEGEVHA